MPGFRGLAAWPGSPRAAPAAPAGVLALPPTGLGRSAASAWAGAAPKGPADTLPFASGGESAGGLTALPTGSGVAPIPRQRCPPSPPRPRLQGASAPGTGRARGEPGGGRAPREQCGGLFCRLSASFPDPPFHAPWPNRHRPSTLREEPPYLVLERKGKGYPQMPAALGHPPAVAGPHRGAVPSPAETDSHYVGHAGLELLGSRTPPAS
ncbi:uncharacterized protein LOC144377677 [Ictidomys tridecemlineatus]